jgi:hypothetical protein
VCLLFVLCDFMIDSTAAVRACHPAPGPPGLHTFVVRPGLTIGNHAIYIHTTQDDKGQPYILQVVKKVSERARAGAEWESKGRYRGDRPKSAC